MQRRWLERMVCTDLIEAGGVVESIQAGRVAMGHVRTPAEKHQSAGGPSQRTPVDLDMSLLLILNRQERHLENLEIQGSNQIQKETAKKHRQGEMLIFTLLIFKSLQIP